MPIKQSTDNKTALILAGGGILGVAYEIGALAALDKLFVRPFDSCRFDQYVGISGGSIVAALIANQVAAGEIYRAMANNEKSVFNFSRRDIYGFEGWRLISVFARLIRHSPDILHSFYRHRWSFRPNDLWHMIQEQLPAGVFQINKLEQFIRTSFYKQGLRNDFASLCNELYIPAYDLDRGQRQVFCRDQQSSVPVTISQAIAASCAISFFFEPYRINGRDYIDALTGRVAHLDIAIERGAKLIVLINPRVPMKNDNELFCLPTLTSGQCSKVASLGASFAWEQAQRIELKEKLALALENCRLKHPEVDIVVIEPGCDESLMFFQNPMGNAVRNQIMQHGYITTLSKLYREYSMLQPLLAKHNIQTSDRYLSDQPPAVLS